MKINGFLAYLRWLSVFLGISFMGACRPSPCWARVIYVAQDSDGTGDSWASPMPSLQRAIDVSQVGDDIWIKSGVYRPENQREATGDHPLASSFVLKPGVALYGSFAGTESSPSERTAFSQEAWNQTAPGISTQLVQHTNASGSVVIAEKNGDYLLDGIVIQGGRADGSEADGCGGGVRGQGTLHVNHCIFKDNQAHRNPAIYWLGPLDIDNTQFLGNHRYPSIELFPECHLSGPWIYGGKSAVRNFPESKTLDCVPAGFAEVCQRDGILEIRWKKAGGGALRVMDESGAVLKTVGMEVSPRPLVVAADEVILIGDEPIPSPNQLTWTLAAGSLCDGDTLVGELSVSPDGRVIRQGTLAVQDGQKGKNYRIVFYEADVTREE